MWDEEIDIEVYAEVNGENECLTASFGGDVEVGIAEPYSHGGSRGMERYIVNTTLLRVSGDRDWTRAEAVAEWGEKQVAQWEDWAGEAMAERDW